MTHRFRCHSRWQMRPCLITLPHWHVVGDGREWVEVEI